MNIIEIIQKNLGYNSIEKIDPNTQEPAGKVTAIGNHALIQAGVPAVLLGLFNRLEQTPSLSALEQDNKTGLLDNIFGKSCPELVNKISDYAKLDKTTTKQELEHVACESIRVIKENVGEAGDENAIRNYVAKQKPEVKLYLPPALELGEMLKNNNLDDRTGKMEGPVSSFMHSVEKAFNKSN